MATENISAQQAIDYELAGRLPTQEFKDLRSSAKARQRQYAELEKYWSYRTVDSGQVGRQHHELPHLARQQPLVADAPIVDLTKHDLYTEAQKPPRPRKTHRRPEYYASVPQNGRVHRQWKARRHATGELRDQAEEAQDPDFKDYVAGPQRKSDDDPDRVYRLCDICWPEFYRDPGPRHGEGWTEDKDDDGPDPGPSDDDSDDHDQDDSDDDHDGEGAHESLPGPDHDDDDDKASKADSGFGDSASSSTELKGKDAGDLADADESDWDMVLVASSFWIVTQLWRTMLIRLLWLRS